MVIHASLEHLSLFEKSMLVLSTDLKNSINKCSQDLISKFLSLTTSNFHTIFENNALKYHHRLLLLEITWLYTSMEFFISKLLIQSKQVMVLKTSKRQYPTLLKQQWDQKSVNWLLIRHSKREKLWIKILLRQLTKKLRIGAANVFDMKSRTLSHHQQFKNTWSYRLKQKDEKEQTF